MCVSDPRQVSSQAHAHVRFLDEVGFKTSFLRSSIRLMFRDLGHGVGILLASVRHRTIPGKNKVTSNHFPPIGSCWAIHCTCYVLYLDKFNRSSGSSPLQIMPSFVLLYNVDVIWI